jgi:hypothetical protein
VEVAEMPTGSGLEWLSRAAEQRMCPLCVAARDFENKYLHGFCQSLTDSGQEVTDFVGAPGFCLNHTAQFEQALLNGEAPVSDAVDVYLETLDALVNQLADLEQDDWLRTADRPACVSRDRQVLRAAQMFVAALEHVPRAVEETLRAGGLCVGHFMLVWVSSDEAADRKPLRDIQRQAFVDLIGDLREARSQKPGDGPDREQELIAACTRGARWVSGWTITSR